MSVTFSVIDKSGKVFLHDCDACFSELKMYNNIDKVLYPLFEYDKYRTFYRCCRRWLKDVTIRKGVAHIKWTYYTRFLFQASILRYPAEFSGIVDRFLENRQKYESNFELFLLSHHGYGVDGHLITGGTPKLSSLEDFYSKKHSSIHSVFVGGYRIQPFNMQKTMCERRFGKNWG